MHAQTMLTPPTTGSVSLKLEDWIPWEWQHAGSPAKTLLFCFPFAGGGASVFRTWAASLPESIQPLPVRLPGRESRWLEQPYDSLPALVPTLADVLAPALRFRFAFFGHSMGAFIAFELTRELRRRGQPGPVRLLVSGCRAPHLQDPDIPLYALPKAELIGELGRLEGVSADVLANSEFMELILPMLRADLRLCDTYRYRPGLPLDCPISGFGGAQDKKTRPEQLAAWSRQTRAGYIERVFPGGHFFLTSAQTELVAAIATDLKQP
jgi:medium-chain acyl-[acyl-carrier-protein] hydrolase